MSNPSEVINVKSFLKEQYITVSSEWVQACISFIKGEYGRNLSLQQVKNYVYQQWLNADLEEIGACSFGPFCKDLLTTQKVTLNGKFSLQVEGIRDVGRPAYAQLKELENSENSNAEFSADVPPTQAPWEAKPTRMLMLKLTDGCSHIQGMEYRPINTLSPNLPPGVKVLVQGPIDCRFGVLMLTPDKIKVLGGEVEDKLVKFSRKFILKGILGLPLEESSEEGPETQTSRPSTQNEGFSSQATMSTRTNQTSQIPNSLNPRQQSSASSRVHNNPSASNGGFQSSPWSSSTNRQASFGSSNTPSQNQNDLDGLDDFENEDDDFDLNVDPDVLDELERESVSKSQSRDTSAENHDVWQEDDDVMQEVMAFQDENDGFEMPVMGFEEEEEEPPQPSVQWDKPFTYLESVLKQQSPNCTITVKAFIISVLSKLECTPDKGWCLMVKINDGTATLDVNIHDKVLETIMGISAPVMVKMKTEAADNPETRKKVSEAISKCRVTLQDFNCLMDIKFTPGCKPCLIKYQPISQLDAQQLLERVRSSLKN